MSDLVGNPEDRFLYGTAHILYSIMGNLTFLIKPSPVPMMATAWTVVVVKATEVSHVLSYTITGFTLAGITPTIFPIDSSSVLHK